MPNKGGKGGFLDDFFNKPFGGLFDINGDGKEDLGEQWIAFKMFEEATKDDDATLDDFGDAFDSDLGDL